MIFPPLDCLAVTKRDNKGWVLLTLKTYMRTKWKAQFGVIFYINIKNQPFRLAFL